MQPAVVLATSPPTFAGSLALAHSGASPWTRPRSLARALWQLAKGQLLALVGG